MKKLKMENGTLYNHLLSDTLYKTSERVSYVKFTYKLPTFACDFFSYCSLQLQLWFKL